MVCLRTRNGAIVNLKSVEPEKLTPSQLAFIKDLAKQDEEWHRQNPVEPTPSELAFAEKLMNLNEEYRKAQKQKDPETEKRLSWDVIAGAKDEENHQNNCDWGLVNLFRTWGGCFYCETLECDNWRFINPCGALNNNLLNN